MNNLRDLITELIARQGQGTLADKIGTDGPALSKFRSDQGALSLQVIEKLIDEAKAIILPEEDYKSLEDALARMSALWIKERAQHNGGKKL